MTGAGKRWVNAARRGPATVARKSSPLTRGITIWRGRIVRPAIAESAGEAVTPLSAAVS